MTICVTPHLPSLHFLLSFVYLYTQIQAIGLDLLNDGNAYYLRLAKPYYPIPTQRDLVLQVCGLLISM